MTTALEAKKDKAQEAIKATELLVAKQSEVKALWDNSETMFQALTEGNDYAEACKAYRVAVLSMLEAIEGKTFKTQKEMGQALGIEESPMSRHIKCAKLFRVATSEELRAEGTDELRAKVLVHKGGSEYLKALQSDNPAKEIAESDKATPSQGSKDISKKIEKAIETALLLMADSEISEEARWSIYTRIVAGAKLAFPQRLNSARQEALVKTLKVKA